VEINPAVAVRENGSCTYYGFSFAKLKLLVDVRDDKAVS